MHRNGEVKVPDANANTSAALGAAAAANTAVKAPSTSFTPFSGSGNSLASAPGSTSSTTTSQPTSSYPESSIQGLVALGVPREEAIKLLDAAGGNPDLAARSV